MTASQALLYSDGQVRTAFANVGQIYFDVGHYHWHYRAFERYWLRRADTNGTVVEDHKTGFCLGDRFIAVKTYKLPGQSYKPSPLFATDCLSGKLTSNSIREGISVGWGDDYVPRLEGQLLDLSTVPDGRYVLVHTVNPVRALHESDYANDSSSLLLTLKRPSPGAAPVLKLLAKCAGTARCDPARRPKLKARPQVLGARVGHRARCAPGRWTQHPRRFYYQWFRFGFIMPSERGATYRVLGSDAGKPLSCRATAVGTFGTGTATSASAVAKR
jgi:lysyl oxidase